MRLPNTAYILLWFPKPSETFILREVDGLRQMGLPISVFTLYGKSGPGISPNMMAGAGRVDRLGVPYLVSAPGAVFDWLKKKPGLVSRLFRTMLFRHWGNLEKTGENLWAFLAGFKLAQRFIEEGIEHIHAPWSGGPATAAWTASVLTGLPFSFTARAWDIHPPDGGLADKVKAAEFVRANTRSNQGYLAGLFPESADRIHLTYNGVSPGQTALAEVRMKSPYQLLAVGRLVAKKGYGYLLEAGRILLDQGLDFSLTIAGDGSLKNSLVKKAQILGLADKVVFPGFVPYEEAVRLYREADLFVMPSIIADSGDRDGIPNVIMEALLSRLPVVATDVSGIPELIRDRETGLLVPQKDAAALAEAAFSLFQNRDQALQMAETGRNLVLTMFDPEKNLKQVMDLIIKNSSISMR